MENSSNLPLSDYIPSPGTSTEEKVPKPSEPTEEPFTTSDYITTPGTSSTSAMSKKPTIPERPEIKVEISKPKRVIIRAKSIGYKD